MKILNVYGQPLAPNICDQIRRVVDSTDAWSIAHVLMNPGAISPLHNHENTAGVYAITRGNGVLVIGQQAYQVQAGSVMAIPPRIPHQLFNTGIGSLEHLVLASPAFDPNDVHVMDYQLSEPPHDQIRMSLPPMMESFDGSKVVGHECRKQNISFAFSWYACDQNDEKKPHYHEKATEWIYVIEGKGMIVAGDDKESLCTTIYPGDWIKIEPGEAHALRNNHEQHLLILSISDPVFNVKDVHYYV